MATDLNLTVLALQIEQGVKFVHVKFHKENGDFDLNGAIDDETDEAGVWSARNYLYKVDPVLNDQIDEGSFVVVQARNHFQVVKVVEKDVELDFGDRTLINNLRWVIADVSARLEVIQDLTKRERQAKKRITNARLNKEAKEILQAANISADDIQLLSGTVFAAGKMPDPKAADVDGAESSDKADGY